MAHHDVLSVDASLDMYDRRDWPGAKADGAAAVSYPASFLRRCTGAQRAGATASGRACWRGWRSCDRLRGRDETFVARRTNADPRCLDLSLDADDRAPGSVWGDARAMNEAFVALQPLTTRWPWLLRRIAADSELARHLGAEADTLVLVRPDAYVAAQLAHATPFEAALRATLSFDGAEPQCAMETA